MSMTDVRRMGKYATLADAVEELALRGFTERRRIVDGQLRALGTGKVLRPKDFLVREYHRFEGSSDPDDIAIVYALESKGGIRGTVVDAYGVYSDPAVSAVLADIPIQEAAESVPEVHRGLAMSRIRRLMHPTDFSRASSAAFKRALEMARGNHAELILVHVMSLAMLPVAEDSYMPPKGYKEMEAAARVSAEKHLNRLIAKAQQAGVRVKGLLLEGIAHERIARAARSHKTDLVVIVSTDGRSLENTEVGSPPTASDNVPSPIAIGRRDRMLGLEDFMTIQALVKRGVYLCDIAEQLGVHRKTVGR